MYSLQCTMYLSKCTCQGKRSLDGRRCLRVVRNLLLHPPSSACAIGVYISPFRRFTCVLFKGLHSRLKFNFANELCPGRRKQKNFRQSCKNWTQAHNEVVTDVSFKIKNSFEADGQSSRTKLLTRSYSIKQEERNSAHHSSREFLMSESRAQMQRSASLPLLMLFSVGVVSRF